MATLNEWQSTNQIPCGSLVVVWTEHFHVQVLSPVLYDCWDMPPPLGKSANPTVSGIYSLWNSIRNNKGHLHHVLLDWEKDGYFLGLGKRCCCVDKTSCMDVSVDKSYTWLMLHTAIWKSFICLAASLRQAFMCDSVSSELVGTSVQWPQCPPCNKSSLSSNPHFWYGHWFVFFDWIVYNKVPQMSPSWTRNCGRLVILLVHRSSHWAAWRTTIWSDSVWWCTTLL